MPHEMKEFWDNDANEALEQKQLKKIKSKKI